MILKKYFILTLLFFVITSFGFSETHTLNFNQSLDIAMKQSYRMRTLKQNLLISKYQLTATTNSLKTKIDLRLKIPNYTETMRQFEDSSGVYYTPIRQSYYSSNLIINQPLPTDGFFYLSSGFYNTDDFNMNKNTIQLNTRVGFQQPIEAIYSYNKIKTSLKQAKLNYELSEKRLTRAQLDLKYEVSLVFFYLVSQREKVKIAQQTFEHQNIANNLAQNKYKAGVIAEVEALQMEVDLAEAQNNLDIAQEQEQAQEDKFKQLLGIKLQDKINLNYDLSYKPIIVDQEFAVKRGLEKRLEIRENEINRDLANIDIQRTKLNGQITGKISGYYDFIGVGVNDRNIAFGTTFNDAISELKDRPGNKGISFDLSIPIWDWGVNKARVRAAQSRLRNAEYTLENERVNVIRDIRETVNQLRSSLRRLTLLEKNIIIAEKSFEISQKRFANGDIDSQTLALNRNRLNQAYKTKLEAFISYKLAVADLMRKTFYDFETSQEI